MIKPNPKLSRISGAALLVIGVVSEYFKIATELKFADLGSGSPNWVPPPRTDLDVFMLWFPAGLLTLIGAALLIASWFWRRP